jgi:hypothetical protein
MIEPTIGRKVWFRPTKQTISNLNLAVFSNQPLDATICYVWDHSMVNLQVTDHAGYSRPFSSVTLLQDGQAPPEHDSYCEWMPYQKGQAAKTEQAMGLGAMLRDELSKKPGVPTEGSEE